MKKIVFDGSILGLSYYHEQAKTGVFRVAEALFNGLRNHPEIEFNLGFSEHLPENLVYLKHEYKNDKFNIVNLKDDLRKASFENAITKPFPKKSIGQKIVRELFTRTRGYTKPFFDFDKSQIEHSIYHSPFLPIPNQLALNHKKTITIHDLIPKIYPAFFNPWNIQITQKIIASIDKNTKPICVSESTKNDLCEIGKIDAERVSVVHLAACKEKFNIVQSQERINQTLIKLNIPTDQKYLLSISTLEPRKNIESTIQSFSDLILQEKIQDLNLVLVGSKGWKFDSIFEKIKTNPSLKNRIFITGFVDDFDLAPLYSGALGFVYPSLYEGFGLPLLEAMQCGTPVIGSNNSSIPEVVGKGGILINATDTGAITEAMSLFYSKENERLKLKENAILQAQKFSWDKFIQQHIEIFNQC